MAATGEDDGPYSLGSPELPRLYGYKELSFLPNPAVIEPSPPIEVFPPKCGHVRPFPLLRKLSFLMAVIEAAAGT